MRVFFAIFVLSVMLIAGTATLFLMLKALGVID